MTGSPVLVRISLGEQVLRLINGGGCVAEYRVSTAARGAGCESGSYCTPLGQHVIRACIGAGLPPGAVLVGRRPTGEVWTPQLAERYPERDWVLSRILWLSGCERGVNRLGSVDSMRRYIYIHGTADDAPMGKPLSHGCIRMTNNDVCDLFERVQTGTPVQIDV